MKTLIFYLVLTLFGTAQAQEFTELKEAKVGFAPLSSTVERDGNSFSFDVRESHAGEFENDPLAFMEENFDINNFIAEVVNEDYDLYEVSFKSRKGFLRADFNKDGELLRSSSRFENTLLPENLRDQLYRDHKGWAMTRNVHVTVSKDGLLKKDYYKVRLENGKEKKKVNLEGRVEGTEVVFN